MKCPHIAQQSSMNFVSFKMKVSKSKRRRKASEFHNDDQLGMDLNKFYIYIFSKFIYIYIYSGEHQFHTICPVSSARFLLNSLTHLIRICIIYIYIYSLSNRADSSMHCLSIENRSLRPNGECREQGKARK